MPRILSYTPPWLSRPSPGSKVFSDTESPSRTSPSKGPSRSDLSSADLSADTYQGPHRLLANRGTEIFTVSGNKIRWASLTALKDDWEGRRSGRNLGSSDDQNGIATSSSYRTLSAPIYQQIRQLSISPSGKLLAILTEHTVHVAVLPDSSRLADHDRSPIKLKTYQLGPTTHVIPQSPVVSALWHPLAVSDNSTDCLITITAEAAVRIWEMDRSNHWSFDRPSLAIDLKKLIDGTSCDEDYEPSGFGKTRGFSADIFDMEATSACFAGQGLDEEDGWASMTLWVVMRNGDVYALCPLLPSRWRPTSTTIPSLSTSVIAKMAGIEDESTSPDEKQAIKHQYEWVQEMDDEEGLQPNSITYLSSSGVRNRPSRPSAVPRLQGPFEIGIGNDEDDLEVSDIHVVAAKIDVEELLSGDEDDYEDIVAAAKDGLSATVILITATSGDLYIFLDVEGISGQWLPRTKQGTFTVPVSDSRDLILVETLDTKRPDAPHEFTDWPIISPDVTSRYSFFVTGSKQVTYVSLVDWVLRLDSEISSQDPADSGFALRLKIACDGSISLQEDILDITEEVSEGQSSHLSSALILRDPDLGYMLLTSRSSLAYAVSFDIPNLLSTPLSSSQFQISMPSSMPGNSLTDQKLVETSPSGPPPRTPYTPAAAFYESPTGPLKHLLTMDVPQRQKMTLKQEIRLSPATLNLMMTAHRILSSQTSQLEKAAAELFRRCERLQEELQGQVRQMTELASRMHHTRGNDETDEVEARPDCSSRLEQAQVRQKKLMERYENLRRRVGRATAGGKELSFKETAWTHEMSSLESAVGIESDEPGIVRCVGGGGNGNGAKTLVGETLNARFDMVKQLSDSLVQQTQKLKMEQDKDENLSAKSRQAESSSPLLNQRTASNSSQRSARFSATVGGSGGGGGGEGANNILVPSKLQKAKIAEAMTMVEREGAVIDAAVRKLERLKLSY